MLGASVSRTPRTHKHTTGTCVSACRRPTPHSLIGIISSRAAVRARTSRRPAPRRRRRRRRPRRPRYVGERPVHVIGDCADAADAPASRHVPRRRVSLVSTASDRGGPGCGRATGRLSWGRPLAGPVRVPVRTHTHTHAPTDRHRLLLQLRSCGIFLKSGGTHDAGTTSIRSLTAPHRKMRMRSSGGKESSPATSGDGMVGFIPLPGTTTAHGP